MKKLSIPLVAAICAALVYFMISGAFVRNLPENRGVRYIGSQSRVTAKNDDEINYSLCFENLTEKQFRFCVYGVFGSDLRLSGLDENGILKEAVLQPYEKANIDFIFKTAARKPLEDVVIIGEYNQYHATVGESLSLITS